MFVVKLIGLCALEMTIGILALKGLAFPRNWALLRELQLAYPYRGQHAAHAGCHYAGLQAPPVLPVEGPIYRPISNWGPLLDVSPQGILKVRYCPHLDGRTI